MDVFDSVKIPLVKKRTCSKIGMAGVSSLFRERKSSKVFSGSVILMITALVLMLMSPARVMAQTDATLSDLTITGVTLNPTFDGSDTYTASVPNGTTNISVIPTTTDPAATITIGGNPATSGAGNPVSLNVGPNTINIMVTAQDGITTKPYTITVTRALSSVATLSGLAVSGVTLSPGFSSGQNTYTGSVPNGTTSVTVTPTATEGTETIKVNGTTVASGGTSAGIPLVVGANPAIDITVTAEDGTTNSYSVTVTRAASNVATLSSLGISAGTLSPAFSSGNNPYTTTVPNGTTSITVTPTLTDATATIKVNGTTVANGGTSGGIALAVGANPAIDIVVTAQDGTINTYTLTVTRAASNVATLSSLGISAGTLSPAFSSGNNPYTTTVPNSTTSITVTPTLTDATATIKVNGTTVANGGTSGGIALAVGANPAINIVVTAQDGTINTYTLTVTRAASNVATLSSLGISAGTLSPAFSSGNNPYTTTVPNGTTSITVTPTLTDATATIKVNGTTVANGGTSGGIALAVGANPAINIVITAQDGTINTYTLTVTRAASNVATLSSLGISAGTLSPAFSSGNNPYTTTVPNGTTSITVTPTLTDATATIKVNGTTVANGGTSAGIALSVGANPAINIVVTAQDGTINTYTLTVTRTALSTVATLSDLVVSGVTLSPGFTSGQNTYTGSVPNATTSVTITPTATDGTSTIKVNGTTVASGGTSAAIPLTVGANPAINVVVTAQDGTTTNTYTVTVTRAASTVATLSALTLSAGTLSPGFTSGNVTYTANVPNANASITVTPTTTATTATVTVNGTTVASGTASAAIPLTVGVATPINVVVTAQDGTTTDSYTVTATRVQSTVATLSALTLSAGTLSPGFTSGNVTYTASVPNANASITVTPTTTATTATVTVNGTTVASGTASAAIPLTVGVAKPINVVVTAQDGTTTDSYTVTATRVQSSVATLSALSLSAGTLSPGFTSGNITYTASVPNANASITVTPTTTATTATVTVNGTTVASGTASAAIPLTAGVATPITVAVTAEDGTLNTYTVTATRAVSADATLSNLTISNGTLSPAFDPGTTTYSSSQANAITGITVTPTATDAGATITVNGVPVTSGQASGLIALQVGPIILGPNVVTIVVTAADGTTTDTYTINIGRAASATATLSNLVVSGVTLTPAFSSGQTSYTGNVPNATTSVTVTPTVSDATSTVTVNGTAVTSGSPSGALPLIVGPNTITTVVTAQDGTTTTTYTVVVTRAASTTATLSNLTISAGTLNPAFASGTNTYTASVGNAVTSLTVTPTVSDATSMVTVNGTAVTSGNPSGALPLIVGPNTITTVVTAQDGTTTNTYTITVTRAPSADATLSNLTLSNGILTPAFASGTITYTASVGNAVTSITVTPTVNDATATVTVNGTAVTSGSPSGALPLIVGPNTITTVVTAQDGTITDTYTVTVTRAPSADATLSNLVLSTGTLAPPFASGTTSYSAGVPNATTSITVTPTTNDATATVTVNGAAVTSGTASAAIPLTVGTNTITTVVTAQDGSTTNTYTITLSRAPSASASLSNLVISSGTLVPTFASGTTSYDVAVTNATTSITVTPTTSDATATVTVNGTAVTSGSPSGSIALQIGPNVITTIVTAQDGVTTGTYTLTVTRAPSSDATLSNLAISAGTLAPAFASGTLTYTAGVDNATTSITVTPTVNDATATVTVNGTSVTSGSASGAIALAVGPNVITTVVTAQDGTTTGTYTITVTRAPSTAASLANLTISSGTLAPTFASGTTNYTADVTNTTASITVTPTTTDAAATVTVNGVTVASGAASGPIALQFGANPITIVVTAQDGTTKGTYNLVVTREASAVSTLSNLTISSGTLAPVFTSGTTSYAVSVTNATTSVTVTPTASDGTATIKVNGTTVASGSASGAIALQVGSNVITVVVTAQDGSSIGTYTVTVDRPALTAVTLSNLTISTGSLAPVFDGQTFSYVSAVGNTVTSLTVTPTASDATATIKVNGTTVGSGTASGPIALQVGANVITVLVTSQGGLTTSYTITVARASSAIALLSNLTISNGVLAPVFDSNTFGYIASVDNSVSEVSLTPTTVDPNASIKINGITATSGSPSALINLVVGSTTINVVVTAADGTSSQTYTVTVTRDVAKQDVVLANNILTPNGDGKNDTWFIKNILSYPNNTVTVYDHSGRVIYTKKGYTNDWDGSFKGSPLSEDTYYYLIDLGTGKSVIKGFITVVKTR